MAWTNRYWPTSAENRSVVRAMISLRTSDPSTVVEIVVVAVQVGHPVTGERRAQDAGIGDDSPFRWAQRVEPRRDQRLERCRGADRVEVDLHPVGGHVAAVAGDDRVAVDERPDRLHREQRHALGAIDQRRACRCGKPLHEAVEQPPHCGVVEGVHPDHGGPSTSEVMPTGQQLRAGKGHDEHRALCGGKEVVDEVEQALVGVLGVVDDQHDRARISRARPGGEVLEERGPRREEVLAGEPASPGADQDGQPRAQPVALCTVDDESVQGGVELLLDDLPDVALHESEPGPDGLGERPERDPVAVGEAASAMPPGRRREPVDVLLELPDQS